MKKQHPTHAHRKILLFQFILSLFFIPAFSADYFWIGGSGNWSDYTNHWATSSGGTVFHNQVPSPADNVYFDKNSFPNGGTLNCDVNAFCNNIYWDSSIPENTKMNVAANDFTAMNNCIIDAPIIWYQNSSGHLNIGGSLALHPQMDFNVYRLYFIGTAKGNTIESSGNEFRNVAFRGNGGEWTLKDSLVVEESTDMQYGSLVSAGNAVNLGKSFNGEFSDASFSLNFIGTDTVRVGPEWRIYTGKSVNISLEMGASTLLMEAIGKYSYTYFYGGSYHAYNNITIRNNYSESDRYIFLSGNNKFNKLHVVLQGTQPVYFNDPCIYNAVHIEYKNPQLIEHPEVRFSAQDTIGSLTISAGGSVYPNCNIQSSLYCEKALFTAENVHFLRECSFGKLSFVDTRFVYINYKATQTLNEIAIEGTCNKMTVFTSDEREKGKVIIKKNKAKFKYCYISNIAVDASIDIVAIESVDDGNNSGILFSEKQTHTYYWIGGTGNWEEPSNWSQESGGIPAECIPQKGDDVVFDNNSFANLSDTVYVQSSMYVNSISCSKLTKGNYYLKGNENVYIHGSVNLNSHLHWRMSNDVYFRGKKSGLTLNMAHNSFLNNVYFQAPGSEYSLEGQFIVPRTANTYVHNGTISFNNNIVDFGKILYATISDFEALYRIHLDFTNTPQVLVGAEWRITSNSLITVNMAGVPIYIKPTKNDYVRFYGGGNEYADIYLNHSSNYKRNIFFYNEDTFRNGYFTITGTHNVDLNNSIWDSLSISYLSETATSVPNVRLYRTSIGAFSINSEHLEVNANIEYDGIFGSIAVSPKTNLILEAGRTFSVNNLSLIGNCTGPIQFQSNSIGEQATIQMPKNNSIQGNFVYMQDINAKGEGSFNVTGFFDLGNNTGWKLENAQARTFYWIGGSGNWNDTKHWSYSSGDAPQGCMPSAIDNVIFDKNSFLEPDAIVTLSQAVTINKMVWTNDVFGNPKLDGGVDITVVSLLDLQAEMKWEMSRYTYLNGSFVANKNVSWISNWSYIYFYSDKTDNIIDFNGLSIVNKYIYFNTLSGKIPRWTLASNFLGKDLQNINIQAGEFVSNGYDVDFGRYFSAQKGVALDFTGTKNINVQMQWYVYSESEGSMVNMATSNLLITPNYYSSVVFKGGNHVYNNIEIQCEDKQSSSNDVTYTIDDDNVFNAFNIVVDNNNTAGTQSIVVNGTNTFGNYTFLSQGLSGPYIYFNKSNAFRNLVLAGRGTRLYLGGGQKHAVSDFTLLGTGGYPAFLYSTIDDTQATLVKEDGEICLDFVWMKDVKAEGDAVFNAGISSTDLGNNTGWDFKSCLKYYWVGGTGSWTDLSHWATSSGGDIKHFTLPTKDDDVYFDANSFTDIKQVVTIDTENAECKNMNWQSVFFHPTLVGNSDYQIDIYGSLILSQNMNQNWNGVWNFKASEGKQTIDVAKNTLTEINILGDEQGNGATWDIYNHLNVSKTISLNAGTLNTNSFGITTSNFIIDSPYQKELSLSNSTITIKNGNWIVHYPETLDLDAGNSKIIMTGENVNQTFDGGDKAYFNVTYSTDEFTTHSLFGSNSFNTFSVNAGVTLIAEILKEQTANQFIFNGECSRRIEIKSNMEGLHSSFIQKSGVVEANFLKIQDNMAMGKASFIANMSEAMENVTGWKFTAKPMLALSINAKNVTCPSLENGEAVAVVTGGYNPIVYNWSTLHTTQKIENLVPGTYWVDIVDSLGCIASDTVQILTPDSYGFTIESTVQNSCGEVPSGSVELTVIGAKEPINYEWSSGQVTNSISDIGAGTYSATVTDAAGCEETVSVIVNTSATPTIEIEQPDATCVGEPCSFSSTVSSGMLLYLWTFGDGTTSSEKEPVHIFNNSGAENVQCTVTNGIGCSATDEISVEITQCNAPPVAFCIDATVSVGKDCQAFIDYADIDNGSFDPDNEALQYALSENGPFSIGVYDITLLVSDSSGLTDSCSAMVTVVDNSSPKALSKDITVSLNADGIASISASDVDGGSSDNCGIASMSVYPNEFTCENIGDNGVTFTVTDASGNVSETTAKVTVIDNLAPQAVAKDVTVSLNANGKAIVLVNQVDGGSSDNCGIATVTVSPNEFSCEDIGKNEITLTVTDFNGNVSKSTAIVTVVDDLAPRALSKDITVSLNADGIASISASDVDGGSSDNCGIVSMSVFPNEFTCENIGDNGVTLTVADASGNVSETTAKVTVIDNLAPQAVAKDVTVSLNANGKAIVLVNQVDGGSSDNCGIATVTVSPNEFSCEDIGTNEVTLTVIDFNGNISKSTAIVTVVDDLAPRALSKDITVSLNADGIASISASDVDGGSRDNCGIASMSVFPNEFTCENIGDNGVTLTVTDVSGNVSETTAKVTVIDNLAPKAVAKDVTVSLNANGKAIVSVDQVDGGSSDNCGIATVTVSPNEFSCKDIGTNEVTLTVSDFSGNVSKSVAKVMVVDDLAPRALSKDITVSLNTDGIANISASDIDGGSSDNCGIVSMSVFPNEFTCENIGDNGVTFTVTDASGNVSETTAKVTVIDNLSPKAIAKDVTVSLNANGKAIVSVDQVDGGSSDNCGIATVTVSPNEFSCKDIGTNEVTLTVIDFNGNVSKSTAIVTVVDDLAPRALSKDITVSLNADGISIIKASDVDGGSSDNCGIASMSVYPNEFTCENIGDNGVTLTVADASGNVSETAAKVTVIDNLSPIVIAKDVTVSLNANGKAIVSADQVNGGSTDNCAIATMLVSPNEFSCEDIGNNEVTLTVTDFSGNVSEGTAIVTVIDDIAPKVVAKDITVSLNTDGIAHIEANQIDGGSTDNCGIARMSVAPNMFNCDNVGENTVVLTVIDANNNSSEITATVTIVDDFAPQALSKDIAVYLDENGIATLEASDIDGGSSDNCGIASMSVSQNEFSCENIGDNGVTLTVTDVHGNISETTAKVTVADSIVPRVIVKDIQVVLDDQGQATISASHIDNGSYDNCSIASIQIAKNSFSCADIGSNNVLFTVTDVNGNTSSAEAIVNIADTTAPHIVCPSNIEYISEPDECEPKIMWDNPIVEDACSYTLTCSNEKGSAFPVGNSVIMYTVIDDSGNKNSCSFSVSVRATPFVAHIDEISNYNGNVNISCAGGSDGFINIIANGGCLPYSFEWSNGEESSLATGLKAGVYTITVSDAQGETIVLNETLLESDPISVVLESPILIGDYNTTCAFDGDGSISLFAEGGVGNYDIVWSNGSIGSELSNLSAGEYEVTVSDENGCSVEESIVLTEPENCDCFDEEVEPSLECKDCDLFIDFFCSVNIPDNKVACIKSCFKGNINFGKNSSLLIHGKAVIQSININENNTVVTVSHNTYINNLNMNGGNSLFENHGNVVVGNYANVGGVLKNYGKLEINEGCNINIAGRMFNYNKLEVGGTFNVNDYFENKGLLEANILTFNSQSTFINSCSINAYKSTINSNVLNNQYGTMVLDNELRLNSTFLHVGAGSITRTENMYSNSTTMSNEGESCALIKIEDYSEFNGGKADGEIGLCDENGVEQNNNFWLENGAVFSCSGCGDNVIVSHEYEEKHKEYHKSRHGHLAKNKFVKLAPNPVYKEYLVSVEHNVKNATLLFTNGYGVELMRIDNVQSGENISLSKLPSGLYTVYLIDTKGISVSSKLFVY